MQGGHHQAQVGGDRCLAGEQRVDLLLHLLVQLVHHGVAGDHALADARVGVEQRGGGALHRAANLVGHGHEQRAHLGQLCVELLAHRFSLKGAYRIGTPVTKKYIRRPALTAWSA